jgi:hypothetical protein
MERKSKKSFSSHIIISWAIDRYDIPFQGSLFLVSSLEVDKTNGSDMVEKDNAA